MGIGLVLEFAGIDARLARRKLDKKIHSDHVGRQRPTAAMVPPTGSEAFDNHPISYATVPCH